MLPASYLEPLKEFSASSLSVSPVDHEGDREEESDEHLQVGNNKQNDGVHAHVRLCV